MAAKQKNSALASKIKRIMQADEDVGKIAQLTPVVIAQAMELFLERLAKGASEIALARADKVLHTAHLKEFVKNEASMDFLKAIVEKAPELQEKKATTKRKYVKKEKAEGEAGKSGKDEEGDAEVKPAPKRRKKAAAAPKGETGDLEEAAGGVKAEPAAAEEMDASPPGGDAPEAGQFQRTWQTTGQRSLVPATWAPPEQPQVPPPSLMGVLKDAAAPPASAAEFEEDDYDAE